MEALASVLSVSHPDVPFPERSGEGAFPFQKGVSRWSKKHS